MSNVNGMGNMFYIATSFNQDIGSWNVSNVLSMHSMFYYATAFNQNLENWDVTRVEQCDGFSTDAISWTLPKPNFTNCTE